MSALNVVFANGGLNFCNMHGAVTTRQIVISLNIFSIKISRTNSSSLPIFPIFVSTHNRKNCWISISGQRKALEKWPLFIEEAWVNRWVIESYMGHSYFHLLSKNRYISVEEKSRCRFLQPKNYSHSKSHFLTVGALCLLKRWGVLDKTRSLVVSECCKLW